MERELKLLSRRMDLVRHLQIEADHEVDQEADPEVDLEVVIDDQDHVGIDPEVEIEEVEAEAEVVVDDLEADHE